MAKRLTEEAVNILETYLQEDELISELYENEIVNEEDILRLHEALSVVEEWDELLSEQKTNVVQPGTEVTLRRSIKDAPKTKLRKKARHFITKNPKTAVGIGAGTLAAGYGLKKLRDARRERR